MSRRCEVTISSLDSSKPVGRVSQMAPVPLGYPARSEDINRASAYLYIQSYLLHGRDRRATSLVSQAPTRMSDIVPQPTALSLTGVDSQKDIVIVTSTCQAISVGVSRYRYIRSSLADMLSRFPNLSLVLESEEQKEGFVER